LKALAFLTQVFEIFSCEMHTISCDNIIDLFLNAKPELKLL
jgi:hypothetical protein